MRYFGLFIIAVLTVLAIGCSDDDEMRPLSVSQSSSSFDTLNTCDFSSGSNGTEFTFQLQLQSAPAISVGGVEFDLLWSNGNTSDDILEEDVVINGNTVEYDWCFRFGGTDWFELNQTLVDDDGNPLSNEVKVRVNRPVGAN
jgi:hypothetical protein